MGTLAEKRFIRRRLLAPRRRQTLKRKTRTTRRITKTIQRRPPKFKKLAPRLRVMDLTNPLKVSTRSEKNAWYPAEHSFSVRQTRAPQEPWPSSCKGSCREGGIQSRYYRGVALADGEPRGVGGARSGPEALERGDAGQFLCATGTHAHGKPQGPPGGEIRRASCNCRSRTLA